MILDDIFENALGIIFILFLTIICIFLSILFAMFTIKFYQDNFNHSHPPEDPAYIMYARNNID